MTITQKLTLAQWNLLAASAHHSNANGIPLWGSTTKAGKELAGLGLGAVWEEKFQISDKGRTYYQDNMNKK